jgi:hypothetical protein
MFVFDRSMDKRDVKNCAALLRFERQITMPPMSWLAAVFDQRLVICTALIVALCFVAIRLAEPSQSYMCALARNGAQP